MAQPEPNQTSPGEARQDREFYQPASPPGPDGETRMPAAKARQGVMSGRILTVLCAGLALVAVALVASYMGAV